MLDIKRILGRLNSQQNKANYTFSQFEQALKHIAVMSYSSTSCIADKMKMLLCHMSYPLISEYEIELDIHDSTELSSTEYGMLRKNSSRRGSVSDRRHQASDGNLKISLDINAALAALRSPKGRKAPSHSPQRKFILRTKNTDEHARARKRPSPMIVNPRPKRSMTSTAPVSTHGLKQQTFEIEDFQKLAEKLDDQLTERRHKRTKSGSLAALPNTDLFKPSPLKVQEEPLLQQIKFAFVDFKRRHQALTKKLARKQLTNTERLLMRMMFRGWMLVVDRCRQ